MVETRKQAFVLTTVGAVVVMANSLAIHQLGQEGTGAGVGVGCLTTRTVVVAEVVRRWQARQVSDGVGGG